MSNILPENERWIIGYEGMYSCSHDGNIYSYRRGKNKMAGGVTNTESRGELYRVVSLSVGGNSKTLYFHRIIAEAWVDNPDKDVYTQVDHIDRDKLNNCATNLRWVTPSENIKHMYANENFCPATTRRMKAGYCKSEDLVGFILSGDTGKFRGDKTLIKMLKEDEQAFELAGVPPEILSIKKRGNLLDNWNYIITVLDNVFVENKLSTLSVMFNFDDSLPSHIRSGRRWGKEVELYKKYRNIPNYTKNYREIYNLSE